MWMKIQIISQSNEQLTEFNSKIGSGIGFTAQAKEIIENVFN